jgi:hypothetical protein
MQKKLLRNAELAVAKDKFFVLGKDEEIRYLQDMKDIELDSRIYYSPSWFPLVNITDTTKGSAFKNCTVPTSAYEFSYDGEHIHRTVSQRDKLTLTEYTDAVHQDMLQTISRIGESHDKIAVAFSGGIDSLVILSYLIRLDLLHRTTLIRYENRVQSDDNPDIFRNDYRRKVAMTEIKSLLKDRLYSFVEIDLYRDDLINAFNSAGYHQFRAYGTYKLFDTFRDTALLFGHHGNQVLLHKNIFLEEMISVSQDPYNKRDEIQKLFARSYYSKSIRHIGDVVSYCRIIDRNLKQKEWDALSGQNNNTYYAPLGNMIEQCRDLYFDQIDPITILDAKVARELIHRNVDKLLDPMIVYESLHDGDVYADVYLYRAALDKDKLNIPTDLPHDKEGLGWLRDQLSRDKIELNSLNSVLLLQHLSKLFSIG